jgi:hypothetical protein
MPNRTLAAISAVSVSMLSNVANGQTFDMKVVGDMKRGYFERTYKGKAFSDIGTLELYANRVSGEPYVQMKKDGESVWCVIDDEKFVRWPKEFPVGTRIRMTGKMLEWYWRDDTLFLEENCTISRP